MRPTYNEQYHKVLDAYMTDNFNPYDCRFCINGIIAPIDWSLSSETRVESPDIYRGWFSTVYYNIPQLIKLESLLLTNVSHVIPIIGGIFRRPIEKKDPRYEDALFRGICESLEYLRKIHEEWGEVIDMSSPTKRPKEAVNATKECYV